MHYLLGFAATLIMCAVAWTVIWLILGIRRPKPTPHFYGEPSHTWWRQAELDARREQRRQAVRNEIARCAEEQRILRECFTADGVTMVSPAELRRRRVDYAMVEPCSHFHGHDLPIDMPRFIGADWSSSPGHCGAIAFPAFGAIGSGGAGGQGAASVVNDAAHDAAVTGQGGILVWVDEHGGFTTERLDPYVAPATDAA